VRSTPSSPKRPDATDRSRSSSYAKSAGSDSAVVRQVTHSNSSSARGSTNWSPGAHGRHGHRSVPRALAGERRRPSAGRHSPRPARPPRRAGLGSAPFCAVDRARVGLRGPARVRHPAGGARTRLTAPRVFLATGRCVRSAWTASPASCRAQSAVCGGAAGEDADARCTCWASSSPRSQVSSLAAVGARRSPGLSGDVSSLSLDAGRRDQLGTNPSGPTVGRTRVGDRHQQQALQRLVRDIQR